MAIAVFSPTTKKFGYGAYPSHLCPSSAAPRHEERYLESSFRGQTLKAALGNDGNQLGCKSSTCLGRRSCGVHQIRRQVRCQEASPSSVLSEQNPVISDGLLQSLQSLPQRNILCLSNGHGEDAIAVSVLQELKMLAAKKNYDIQIEALPLVGMGSAYSQAEIQTVGPARTMPSGGFIYMDILQLIGDISAGLLSLTADQWRTITRWLDEKPNGFIIAVGDVFPLALAWLAARQSRKGRTGRGIEYAFVGTAKSEFYLQSSTKNHNGLLASRLNVASLFGGVYLPWERAMMADSSCRLVAPRDNLTAEVLTRRLSKSSRHKIQDLGNPMMDGLEPSGALGFLKQLRPGPFVALLPGSRPPEVYTNWSLLLEAATEVSKLLNPKKVIFLTPAFTSLEPRLFCAALTASGWLSQQRSTYSDGTEVEEVLRLENGDGADGPLVWNDLLEIRSFRKENAVLLLARGGFRDVVHWADAGIAMAGTGTEQLVGLGKPVFTLAGSGPQFTYNFAEAQSRLLGPSVFLCKNSTLLATRFLEVMSDKESLSNVAENGFRRMGKPGAGHRIAAQILSILLQPHQ